MTGKRRLFLAPCLDGAVPSPFRVTVVCTGNICRSPMGEVVLRDLLDEAGLGERVVVDSAGTQSYHVGDGADPRTVATLEGHGHDGSLHRASQFVASSFDGVDLVLAADSGHLRDLRRLARSDEERRRIRLFRSYDAAAVAAGDLEMADPWYGDSAEFEQCFAEVEAASRGVVAALEGELARHTD